MNGEEEPTNVPSTSSCLCIAYCRKMHCTNGYMHINIWNWFNHCSVHFYCYYINIKNSLLCWWLFYKSYNYNYLYIYICICIFVNGLTRTYKHDEHITHADAHSILFIQLFISQNNHRILLYWIVLTATCSMIIISFLFINNDNYYNVHIYIYNIYLDKIYTFYTIHGYITYYIIINNISILILLYMYAYMNYVYMYSYIIIIHMLTISIRHGYYCRCMWDSNLFQTSSSEIRTIGKIDRKMPVAYSKHVSIHFVESPYIFDGHRILELYSFGTCYYL